MQFSLAHLTPNAMRTGYLLGLLILLAAVPARAQWTFLGPPESWYHSDFTIGGNTILLTVTKTTAPVKVYGSTDGGSTWETAFQRGGGARAVAAIGDGFIMQFGGKASYRGDAAGRTWSIVADPGYNVTRYFYDRSNARLYAATQRGALLMSADEGTTWTSLGVPAQDLTFVHARGNTIITGYNGTGAGTYISTDGGATWTDVIGKAEGSPSGGFVAADGSIYLHSTVGFFPAYGKLWRSRDNGATWTELTAGVQGLPGVSILLQSIIHAEGSSILFTSNNKVFASADDGVTWSEKSDGLLLAENGSATQMAIHDGYLYALFQAFVEPGSNFGLYRRPLAELGFGPASAARNNDVMEMALDVVPNPARGAASVALVLERSSTVRLCVYDGLGRRVALLHDGPMEAGEHRLRWDDAVPAGAYVVTAQTGGRVVTRTVLRTE